jgi:protein ImuB
VDRLACLDVPALPLQLLLRRNPSWRALPVAVVADDRPQGVVLHANAIARGHRVLPGMTYASARNLAADLRAAVVTPAEVEQACGELFVALTAYSPRVEPSREEPGVFWIDPRGLVPLFGSLDAWAEVLRAAVAARELECSLVVGFHRERSRAIARTVRGVRVLHDPQLETRIAARAPLSALGLSPMLRDQLAVLGVTTLGDLLRLPAAELRARFGEEAARLHARTSDGFAPVVPRALVDPITEELQLEPPDDDHTRLLFGLRGVLHSAMQRLAARSQAMSALRLRLELDHAPAHEEQLEPAAPTLDVALVVELVRLRLEALSLRAPVATVVVDLEGVRTDADQLALFAVRSRRDLVAAGRALARLRAAFGADSVVRAVLRPVHLPEARFGWEESVTARFPRVSEDGQRPSDLPLCRRVLQRPLPLPLPPRHEPESWLGEHGAVLRMHGPFRISGGWWVRASAAPIERDYFYAETKSGAILWIFWDRPRRRWFLHGYVD